MSKQNEPPKRGRPKGAKPRGAVAGFLTPHEKNYLSTFSSLRRGEYGSNNVSQTDMRIKRKAQNVVEDLLVVAQGYQRTKDLMTIFNIKTLWPLFVILSRIIGKEFNIKSKIPIYLELINAIETGLNIDGFENGEQYEIEVKVKPIHKVDTYTSENAYISSLNQNYTDRNIHGLFLNYKYWK